MGYCGIYVKWVLFMSIISLNEVYGKNFFIDCGSPSNTTIGDRTFLADHYTTDFLFTSENITVKNTELSPGVLYQTARVFTRNTKYNFPVSKNKRLFFRLHLFSFPNQRFDLSKARFSIKVNSFILLEDYTPPLTPTIKEFSINVSFSENLTISIEPSINSLAFINAIELVEVPDVLFPYSRLGKVALENEYRVNVGGHSIKSNDDTLWRFWTIDNMHLLGHTNNLKKVQNIAAVKFRSGLATEVDAPKDVYGTLRRLALPPDSIIDSNVTWDFDVDSGFRHLIRFHICNIISRTTNNMMFDIFVNSWVVSRYLIPDHLSQGFFGAPIYIDFVTPIINDEKLEVTIGLVKANMEQRTAILNGLEIFKMNHLESLVADHPLHKSSQPREILIMCASIAAFCLIIFGGVLIVSKKRDNDNPIEIETVTSEVVHNLIPHMPFDVIRVATENFDESHIIGGGGFGNVYMGELRDGTRVAVKRHVRKTGSNQGVVEFQREVDVLSRLQHRHIVSLLWSCSENNELLLGYEYMENGNLKDILLGSNKPNLSWKQRLEISIGAARALEYLHTGPDRSIIHGDFKSSNILIDGNFMAKVGDMGMARIIPNLNESHVVSHRGTGTVGYMPPEIATEGVYGTKMDVYAFGVVLFEILCAKDLNRLISMGVFSQSLPQWAMERKRKLELDQAIDPRLEASLKPESLEVYWEIAERCVAFERASRPSMTEVLLKLEYALQLQELPNPDDNPTEVSTSSVDEASTSHPPPSEDDVQTWDQQVDVLLDGGPPPMN